MCVIVHFIWPVSVICLFVVALWISGPVANFFFFFYFVFPFMTLCSRFNHKTKWKIHSNLCYQLLLTLFIQIVWIVCESIYLCIYSQYFIHNIHTHRDSISMILLNNFLDVFRIKKNGDEEAPRNCLKTKLKKKAKHK